jgi:hypothetical protein
MLKPSNALSLEHARRQLQDCLEMIDRPRHIDSALEDKAEAILPRLGPRDPARCAARHHGALAARVVHCLKWLEGRSATL